MKNEYAVTWARMKEWNRDRRFRGVSLFALIAFLFYGLALLFVGFTRWMTEETFWAIFYSVTAAACFILAFCAHNLLVWRTYRQYVKLYGQKSWTRTVILEEDCFAVDEGLSRWSYGYDRIRDVLETEDQIILVYANNIRLRLYKNAFTEGDAQICLVFLKAKREENQHEV